MKRLAGIRWHFPMTSVYAEAGLARAVRRSLNLMLLGNLCGSMFGVICGGGTTAMVGLANELHAGDFAFGVINGIPQIATLLQIPFSMMVSRTHHRKKYILTYGLFSRFLWLLFGLIPLVVPTESGWLQIWTLIFLLGVSSCCGASIQVCWFPWFSDLAPVRIRGRWFSLRDTIIACFNLGFGLLTARLLDTLPPENRYVIIFIIGGLIGMADMICFGFCEEVYTTPPQRLAFGEMMRDIVKDQSFMRFTVMWTAWCFTTNLCEPYLSRYSMNEMGLNFTQMTVFGTVAASVGTLLVMRRWGAVLDKSGGRTVMLVAALAASLSNAFYLFSTPGNIWPVMLRNLIGAAFWCGSNLAANSLQLSLAPEKGKASYIAFFSCVTCLAGTALGSMAGGALLETMGSMGWFTGSFDRYKALITLSTILRFSIVILLVPRITDGGENGKIQLRVPTVFTGLHRKRLRK